MSSSSKPKTRAPAHKNTTAFRHNKNSKLTRRLEATVSTGGLCKRCEDKVHWRLKYRKYKPLSVPRKCNGCGDKAVKHAYRTLCVSCALARGVCEGCAGRGDGDGDGGGAKVRAREPTEAERVREENALRVTTKDMTERQRRTVERRVEQGEDRLHVVAEVLGEREEEDDEDDGDDNDDDAGDGGQLLRTLGSNSQ